jgi:hypothetical protein
MLSFIIYYVKINNNLLSYISSKISTFILLIRDKCFVNINAGTRCIPDVLELGLMRKAKLSVHIVEIWKRERIIIVCYVNHLVLILV